MLPSGHSRVWRESDSPMARDWPLAAARPTPRGTADTRPWLGPYSDPRYLWFVHMFDTVSANPMRQLGLWTTGSHVERNPQ